MRALLILLRISIFVGLLLVLGVGWLAKELGAPANPAGEPQIFQVHSGQTGREVAEALEEQKLVTNGLLFRLVLTYYERRNDVSLRTGYFMLDPTEDVRGVLGALLADEPLTRRATIPEGYTLEQTARSLDQQEVVSAQSLWDALKGSDLELGWEFPSDLEGYLFPSTYEFPWDCSGEDAVRQMTGQFRSVVEPLWETYGEGAPLSLKDTVILASLVEREAQVSSERALIAGVYINRLNIGMKLECDATVQYALGESKEILLYKDLEIASPYNTYRYHGLPPGPICSPGAESLEAAMNPEKSDYLFYVRNDVKDDGSHVFGKDYSEHQQNISRFQR